jgi:hypothetical protein
MPARYGGYAELRCRIGGFNVGFEGHPDGATIPELVGAANAIRIIPHSA